MTLDPRFNQDIDRTGTGSSKWDKMEQLFGVSPAEGGLAMWTADSDYATAPCVIDALCRAAEFGVFGYGYDDAAYKQAITWWMAERHGWEIEPDWILTTQGLGHALATAIDLWSPADAPVVIFSPVYHEFAAKIRKVGRTPLEIPLRRDGDRYEIDFDAAEAALTGREKVMLWCSPQNPSGRIWTAEELRAVAAFAEAHDLILISDEIHHDLIYPGHRFVPAHVAAPEASDRLVVLTAASKTFNIAGQRTGNVIIPGARLRSEMKSRLAATDYQPGTLGVAMVTAAYSPEGAEWVDAQMQHLVGNCAAFETAVNAIPGVRALPLEATYLAWVDFSGTGMSDSEISERVRKSARIAPTPGPGFGRGGEGFLRFNLATTRARVEEAGRRLREAFSDLQ
ncbi:MalY/PatB family protein [Litorisediminicola beolgyonensis]|uniref:cysteine-S-conjugate beta-lyase n=1 Tax=Litorisediminicola beolgyonensis TaxID=1173614 RepID=A0ABW3ZD52_9RHOB